MVVVNLLHVGKIAMVRAMGIAIFAPAAVKTVVSINPSAEITRPTAVKVGILAVAIATVVPGILMEPEILIAIAVIVPGIMKVDLISTDQN